MAWNPQHPNQQRPPPINPGYGAQTYQPTQGPPPVYGAQLPTGSYNTPYGTAPTSSRPPPPSGYQVPASQSHQQPFGSTSAYGAYSGPYNPAGSVNPPPGINPELWQWFMAVDRDRSGKITALELQQALMNGNWTPFNAETCRMMIGMFDRDRSGTVDIHEFSALWKYIQDWKSCFDRFDTDRSGNINQSELSSAFTSFGYNLSLTFCQLVMRVFDRRGHSTINFDDFIQCCVMLKSLTDQFRAKDTQLQGVVNLSYEEFLRMVLDNAVVV